MAKEVDSNSFELIKDNPLSAEGVYMYSGKMIGFPDLDQNKLYPVYRPAEELEKAADTFNGVPFIIDHEMLGEGGTPYDKRPANGVLMNVVYKAGKLFGDLKIWSEAMKRKILNGVKELSLGYKSVYERSRGVFKGQRYDFIQRNLRGNHLALVKNGRMGSDIRVYDFREANTFDSVEFNINNKEKEVIMEKDKEQKEVEKKTSDEFVSAEKLYAKFPEHKEWIDANKYSRSEDEEAKKDDKEEKSEKSDKGDSDEEGKKETEDKTIVEKDTESKTGFITKKVEDEKVDKRELIDQIGGILKSKDLDDEIIRTVLKKAEEIAYNGSEKSEADDEEEKKEEVKEEKKEEVKEEETKDGCGMDADEIRKQAKEEAIKTIRAMDDFASKVFPHCGKFTYDSMESVEQMAEEACKKLNLETNGNALATINGFISAKSSQKIVFTLDSKEHKSVNLDDEVKSRLNKIFSK